MPTYLHEVIKGFARSAPHYEHYAEVQLQSAGRLATYMEANTRELVAGPILEVGCGTGIFSGRLLEIMPDRQIALTDACAEMVAQCRSQLSIIDGAQPTGVTFKTADAHTILEHGYYALIAAAFALQWLKELESCLDNLTRSLKVGGKLFFSVPTSGSFPEWKATCRAAGVTCTANSLPEAPLFKEFAGSAGLQLSLCEETFIVRYRSLSHFLQSLKLLGAGTTIHATHLSLTEMRRLLEFSSKQHPDSFPVTYKVLFGHFTRLESMPFT